MNFLLKKPVTLYLAAAAFLFFICCITAVSAQQSLTLNAEEGFYEKPGLNILIFNNAYEGAFNDAKMSAIELIHHDVRTATNGDVRLMPTPEQWDLIPEFVEKKVDKSKQTVQAYLRYPDYDFNYRIATQARDGGVLITVHLDEPLPDDLQGRAGFNMEFLPSAYFEKSYMMDEQTGVFPLYPSGPMQIKEESSFPQYEGFSTSERLIKEGSVQPLPLAVGRHFRTRS
ncbi:MAG: hypothetical protein U5R06_09585 [candidate division KSB1 bacterium]|nr:hypothetical protein [candidate division KSB1 bacterium]